MKTAQGLIDYAIKQIGRGYWWGCFGQTASETLLAQKRAQYPDAYSSYGMECQENFGSKVHDCSGLIKGYLWSDTPDSEPGYNPAEDFNAAGLYDRCQIIDDPIPGALVFNSDLSHVGVYIGNGEVVEAMGHLYGVVKTKLANRNFSSFGLLDFIDYLSANCEQNPAPADVIRPHETPSDSDNVREPQTLSDYAITALSVISGAFGNGQERIEKLNAIGYDAAKVQRIVNALLS